MQVDKVSDDRPVFKPVCMSFLRVSLLMVREDVSCRK